MWNNSQLQLRKNHTTLATWSGSWRNPSIVVINSVDFKGQVGHTIWSRNNFFTREHLDWLVHISSALSLISFKIVSTLFEIHLRNKSETTEGKRIKKRIQSFVELKYTHFKAACFDLPSNSTFVPSLPLLRLSVLQGILPFVPLSFLSSEFSHCFHFFCHYTVIFNTISTGWRGGIEVCLEVDTAVGTGSGSSWIWYVPGIFPKPEKIVLNSPSGFRVGSSTSQMCIFLANPKATLSGLPSKARRLPSITYTLASIALSP